ncbi:MAG TPA: hypothetical protein EYG89_00880 [Bacteroidia bacterium]|nr:hypothetical protein [Bacteroidia bacterium]
MEVIYGEGWFDNTDFWGGMACGAVVVSGIVITTATSGVAGGIALNFAAAACGAYIGSLS